MKATGIVRKIDGLGRIVLPVELRRTQDIEEGAPLEIFTEQDGSIIFRKYSVCCALCGSGGERNVMHKYKEALICDDCNFDLHPVR